jgi:hypothetical protein
MLSILCIAAAVSAMAACSTTQYIGPLDHVDYVNTENVKTSRQYAYPGRGSEELVNTYDEEYTYDDNGHLLKTKITEYIDLWSRDKKYIVWETECKVIGGKPVPYRVSANGVAFLEVEYMLLKTAGNGEVKSDISEKNFIRIVSMPFMEPTKDNWNITLSNYAVGFRPDDRFVKTIRRYRPFGVSELENVLTLGYDNIVLKEFKFSREKLADGIAKSYTGYHYGSQMLKRLFSGNNVSYAYEWEVIEGRICQTKMTYTSKTLKLTAEETYDDSGRRVKETWTVSNPENNRDQPRKIFEQDITY